MNKKVFALFQNRTQALTFSRNLNRLGIKTRIVNSPRELSTSCGLSVQFDYKNLQKARQSLNMFPAQSLVGFYITSGTGGINRYIKV